MWDAEVLGRVRHLHLVARHLTDALLMGAHRSRRVGQAIEFADYQEYLPGMDLRRLDWRVWGRSDRYVVKRFETETELPCTVVLDLSGDLGTGTAASTSYPPLAGSKAGFAITLAATLLYALHRHGEPVGLELLAGEHVRHPSLPPRGGRNHLQTLFLTLASARPGGIANLHEALARVGSRVRRRSWVAVITDGMEEPSRWLPALAAFARRGTDTHLIHLFDPDELQLRLDRPVRLFSPEDGDELPVDPAGARGLFQQVVTAYLDEVKRGVLRFGGLYHAAPTDTRLERLLRQILRGAP